MDGPQVIATNAVDHGIGRVSFPIVTPLEGGRFALPAIVTATDTKIELDINVLRAPSVVATDLLTRRDFGRHSGEWVDLHVLRPRGWTAEILAVAVKKYLEIYRRLPDCMVGVFGDRNLKRFLDTYDQLYPDFRLSDLEPDQRVAAAARCIRQTSFWAPREALGYTRMMFETNSLSSREVLVRVFRSALTDAEIWDVADTQKIHPELANRVDWMLAPEPCPAA